MESKVSGSLLIIGGAEDKENKCEILNKFVELAGGAQAKIVVITAATEKPETVGITYRSVFRKLGVREVEVLDLPSRTQANLKIYSGLIKEASGIFFTGGDQLRITSLLGGTGVYDALLEAYYRGIIIAGTSAGASVMSQTMIVAGDSEESPKKNTLNMAPGIGLIRQVVVDQHFAQRGRIGRLLAAVAQNPAILGLGIDEDTGILVDTSQKIQVIGSQTVTVVDGKDIIHTNASETDPGQSLALVGVRLHVLPPGYSFDLNTRETQVSS